MHLSHKLALGILFISLFVLAALYFLMPKEASAPSASDTPSSDTSAPAPTSAINATFACDGGKSITAAFVGNNVQLQLSDGRNLSLPHAVSADGARYANTDESIVFWNKGNGAFITENGTTTYNNCEAPMSNE